MTDAISTLTVHAESLFRETPNPAATAGPAWFESWTSDRVLAESQRIASLFPTRDPEVKALVEQIFAEPGLESLNSGPDALGPMILHPGGGIAHLRSRTYRGPARVGLSADVLPPN